MPRPDTAIKLRATLIQYLGEINTVKDDSELQQVLYDLMETLGEFADQRDLAMTSREESFYEGGKEDAEVRKEDDLKDEIREELTYERRESWESAYGTVDSIFFDLINDAKFDGPLTLDDYGLLTLSNKIVDSIKDEMDIALEVEK